MSKQAILLLLGAILLSSTGCGTVTPITVKDNHPSFDGNVANSGIIAYLTNGTWLVTSNAHARYNGLIAKYGTLFIPPIGADFGVTQLGTNFVMTSQAVVYFGRMTSLHKAGVR